MSLQTKTDNSHLEGKIRIREMLIENLSEIKVLDTFAGKGVLWEEIKRRNPDKKISVTGIEIERGKNLKALLGDNLKVIPSLDLSSYDFIDIDAYGSPYKQLQAVYDNGTYKDGVLIAITNIQSVLGALPHRLLEYANVTKKMTRQSPVLMYRFGDIAMVNFLSHLGVEDYLAYEPTSRKKYWGFTIRR